MRTPEDQVLRCREYRTRTRQQVSALGTCGPTLIAYFSARSCNSATSPSSAETAGCEATDLGPQQAQATGCAGGQGIDPEPQKPEDPQEAEALVREQPASRAGSVEDADVSVPFEDEVAESVALIDVDLWLGCDACECWYSVSKEVFDHWSTCEFVCTNLGETCKPCIADDGTAATNLIA